MLFFFFSLTLASISLRGNKSFLLWSSLSSTAFPWQHSGFRKVTPPLSLQRSYFLTARNEGNVVESVSFLSRDHYRDKARQGYDQDLSEGTNTVGSLGFVGFMTHIWADGHVTTTLLVMCSTNTKGKIMKIIIWAIQQCESVCFDP